MLNLLTLPPDKALRNRLSQYLAGGAMYSVRWSESTDPFITQIREIIQPYAHLSAEETLTLVQRWNATRGFSCVVGCIGVTAQIDHLVLPEAVLQRAHTAARQQGARDA